MEGLPEELFTEKRTESSQSDPLHSFMHLSISIFKYLLWSLLEVLQFLVLSLKLITRFFNTESQLIILVLQHVQLSCGIFQFENFSVWFALEISLRLPYSESIASCLIKHFEKVFAHEFLCLGTEAGRLVLLHIKTSNSNWLRGGDALIPFNSILNEIWIIVSCLAFMDLCKLLRSVQFYDKTQCEKQQFLAFDTYLLGL